MGLNAQPSGERVHIGFFGLRNAGKSSVVNRVTGQTLSIVSDVKGTTTDPVQKAMELLPIGPVVIIDTPGIDDEGTLGEERVRRALRVLEKTDIAVLVTDSTRGLQPAEQEQQAWEKQAEQQAEAAGMEAAGGSAQKMLIWDKSGELYQERAMQLKDKLAQVLGMTIES